MHDNAEMSLRIVDVLSVAPWIELNLTGDENKNIEI